MNTETHALADRLTRLDAWLDTHPIRGSIDWIVGIEYMRYLLLPWNPRLANEPFCRSVAAALFAQQFANSNIAFADHQAQFAPLAYKQPRLVALVADDVLLELTSFSRRRGYKVRRITPALGVVWNRLFAHVRSGTGTLALIEGARLQRITYAQGHITGVSVHPFSEAKRSAIPSDATWIFPAQYSTDSTGRMLMIDQQNPSDDVRLAYVLCGAT